MANELTNTGAGEKRRAVKLVTERESLLHQLELSLETPMFVLGFVWLVLTVLELTRGLSPFLENLSTLIWLLFVVDFAIKLTVAPRKTAFLRRNWLTLLSLAVPALRVFRVARVFRAARVLRFPPGLRLVKVVGSLNRGMRSLSRSLGRRGFAYVAALTVMVTVLGAAGIYRMEYQPDGYIHDFGTAFWWTAMTLTTMGTDYFPTTAEGRLLCLLLATYGFAIFGYVTATVASFFVEKDKEPAAEPGQAAAIRELRAEIALLREELRRDRQER